MHPRVHASVLAVRGRDPAGPSPRTRGWTAVHPPVHDGDPRGATACTARVRGHEPSGAAPGSRGAPRCTRRCAGAIRAVHGRESRDELARLPLQPLPPGPLPRGLHHETNLRAPPSGSFGPSQEQTGPPSQVHHPSCTFSKRLSFSFSGIGLSSASRVAGLASPPSGLRPKRLLFAGVSPVDPVTTPDGLVPRGRRKGTVAKTPTAITTATLKARLSARRALGFWRVGR